MYYLAEPGDNCAEAGTVEDCMRPRYSDRMNQKGQIHEGTFVDHGFLRTEPPLAPAIRGRVVQALRGKWLKRGGDRASSRPGSRVCVWSACREPGPHGRTPDADWGAQDVFPVMDSGGRRAVF